MENSTLFDVRTVFLNTVLFGAKTTPELLIDSCTSDEFINLLNIDNGIEKDTFFALVSGYSHGKLTNEQIKELSNLHKEASRLTESFEKAESVLNGVRTEIEKVQAQKNKDEIILQIKEYNEKKEAFDKSIPEGVKLIQDGRNQAGVIEHRAGFDVTFSASKSVSTVALVLGDDRLIQGHKEAGPGGVQQAGCGGGRAGQRFHQP